MTVLDEGERAALTDADDQLADLQRALEAAIESGALDRDTLVRLRTTCEQVIRRLNEDLPPQLDAEARDEIRRRLLDLLTLGTEHGEPLDIADRALIEAEAVRHVMRDLLQEQPPARLRNAAEVLALLEGWLPDLSVAQIGELVGMSARQVQRLRRGETTNSSSRLQLVARLVAILRMAWTDQGVFAWFVRPRKELSDRTPLELLDEPECERDLVLLARTGRVQGAS